MRLNDLQARIDGTGYTLHVVRHAPHRINRAVGSVTLYGPSRIAEDERRMKCEALLFDGDVVNESGAQSIMDFVSQGL